MLSVLTLKILILTFLFLHLLFYRRSNVLACGLFGYCGNPKHSSGPEVLANIKILGLYNVPRGDDASGLSLNGGVIKDAGTGSVFTDFIVNQGLYNPGSGSNNDFTVIGHTRKRSVGANTIKEAHPFEIGVVENDKKEMSSSLIGAHNGTLYNWEELLKEFKIGKEGIVSDSHALFTILESIKKDKEAIKYLLESYKGAAALTWYDPSEPNTLYLYHGWSNMHVRNASEHALDSEERPLYTYKVKGGVYYSSTEVGLKAIGAEESEIQVVAHNAVLKYNKGTLTNYDLSIERRVRKQTTTTTTTTRTTDTSTSKRASDAYSQNRQAAYEEAMEDFYENEVHKHSSSSQSTSESWKETLQDTFETMHEERDTKYSDILNVNTNEKGKIEVDLRLPNALGFTSLDLSKEQILPVLATMYSVYFYKGLYYMNDNVVGRNDKGDPILEYFHVDSLGKTDKYYEKRIANITTAIAELTAKKNMDTSNNKEVLATYKKSIDALEKNKKDLLESQKKSKKEKRNYCAYDGLLFDLESNSSTFKVDFEDEVKKLKDYRGSKESTVNGFKYFTNILGHSPNENQIIPNYSALDPFTLNPFYFLKEATGLGDGPQYIHYQSFYDSGKGVSKFTFKPKFGTRRYIFNFLDLVSYSDHTTYKVEPSVDTSLPNVGSKSSLNIETGMKEAGQASMQILRDGLTEIPDNIEDSPNEAVLNKIHAKLEELVSLYFENHNTLDDIAQEAKEFAAKHKSVEVLLFSFLLSNQLDLLSSFINDLMETDFMDEQQVVTLYDTYGDILGISTHLSSERGRESIIKLCKDILNNPAEEICTTLKQLYLVNIE